MTMADDPDDVFRSMTMDLNIGEPNDLVYTSEHLAGLSTPELMDMWMAVEEALVESDELILPKSEWAQDTHNLRFSLRREMQRRNIAI